MSGCYLDTTILVHLAESDEPERLRNQAYVDGHQPAEVAFYAAKEVLAGPVRYICDAHNTLHAAKNEGEAIIGLQKRLRFKSRWRDSAIRTLALSVSEFYKVPAADERKREALQWIKLRASQLWGRANRPTNVKVVQPLSCFNRGELKIGDSGELRGPNDSFNCLSDERCSAAGWLHDDIPAVDKLLNALHPTKLDERAKSKQENLSRRRALREVKMKGPNDFDKGKCRALGDAYFAVTCPMGRTLATTNVDDFAPLCDALGKKFEKPK